MTKAVPPTREVIWPFEDEIKASGWLRARDYGNASLLCSRSKIRTPFLIVLSVVLVSLAILPILTMRLDGWSWKSLAAPAIIIGLMYYSLIHPYVRNYRTLRRIHAEKRIPAKWTFSKAGVSLEDTQAISNAKWGLATKAIITNRYVLLQLGGGLYHTFAAPMFTTPADWHNFRVGIIRNIIGCRACGYDLHGTTSDACPECGKTID